MGQRIDLTQQVQGVLPETNGGAGPNIGLRFSDAEEPSGTINGSNETFILENSPNPSLSLLLFLNKVLQIQSVDYTLSANTIQMTAAPSGSSSFVAWYRYLTFGWSLALSDTLTLTDAFFIDAPVAQLPLIIADQMTMLDIFAYQSPINFGSLVDKLTLLDSSQMFLSPGSLQITEDLILTDALSMSLFIGQHLSDSLVLSDSLSKTLFVTSEIFVDTIKMTDSFLYGLTPVLYQFGDNLGLLDSFTFAAIISLNLSDLMTATDTTDPFNATLSGAWTQIDGTMAYDGSVGLKVLTAGSNNNTFMKRNDVVFTGAMHAQVQVAAKTDANDVDMGPMINVQASAVEGYYLAFRTAAYFLYRVDGVLTLTLLHSQSGTCLVGDVTRLENDGSGHLTAKRNGTALFTFTDTTYVNGTIGVGADNGASATRLINFAGGPGTAVAGMVEAVIETLS